MKCSFTAVGSVQTGLDPVDNRCQLDLSRGIQTRSPRVPSARAAPPASSWRPVESTQSNTRSMSIPPVSKSVDPRSEQTHSESTLRVEQALRASRL